MMAESSDNGASSRVELRLIRLWNLVGALMLLIVGILSLMPVPDVGVSDMLSHLVTYFFLGGWFGLLAANRKALGWTFVGLIIYGILLELLQGMTAYRYAEWGDIFANASGTLVGVTLYFTPLSRVLKLVDDKLALICQR